MLDIARYYLFLIVFCLLVIAPGIVSAAVPTEKMIFIGCVQKAELAFYAAQEKLYNEGNMGKLDRFIRENATAQEYQLFMGAIKQIGIWVDVHDFHTAKEFARNMFYECLHNSYQHFAMEPSPESRIYVDRFEQLLQAEHEREEEGAI